MTNFEKFVEQLTPESLSTIVACWSCPAHEHCAGCKGCLAAFREWAEAEAKE